MIHESTLHLPVLVKILGAAFDLQPYATLGTLTIDRMPIAEMRVASCRTVAVCRADSWSG